MQARSIYYAGPHKLEFTTAPISDPGPGEAQVQALACGVCAWDVHTFSHGPDGPVLPGHEGIGRVVKVGPGVSHLKEGDWVIGIGLGFTERVTVPAKGLYVVPQTRRPQDWIVEPVACIVNGLDQCQLKAADRIAVVGCGFMGLMFVQALSHALVDQLIAIDVQPERLALAKQFGATQTLNAKELDPQELRRNEIDTVIDCTGSQPGLDLSSKILKPGGRLNLFGWNHGTAHFPSDLWHTNGFTIVNATPAGALRNPWPIAIRLLERRCIDLEPLVSHVVPLNQYPNLLQIACKKDGAYLKGVVILSDP